MSRLTGVSDLPSELDLEITSAGDPAQPLVVMPLDDWCDAPADRIARAAGILRRALPLTIGLLGRPPTPRLRPLLDAATLTLTELPVPNSARELVPVADVGDATDRLRCAAARSPRAAVACGQLLRQTIHLDTTAGLAAEASVYSMLLGGTEFARWLTERGEPRVPVAPDHPRVRINRVDDHLSIVLNHPERRNALSMRLREDLLEAVQLADADPTISTVQISGAGPAFCSGGDLDEFGSATDLVAAYLVRLTRAPWRVIDRIADRVTVRVHGACIGAGTEVTAFAGMVVAQPDAFFAFPEVHMGLVPGAGGTVSVPRRIGRWRAAWLMLTGHRLDARTALCWGLVDQLATGREADHAR